MPSYYIKGDRFLSVIYARIRNNCSNLYNDLYLNHLMPYPLCSCNLEKENAEHYFFRCPKYLNERITLFNETRNFHPLSLDTLIHGDDHLTFEENMCIFTAVHMYIKNTDRFPRNH